MGDGMPTIQRGTVGVVLPTRVAQEETTMGFACRGRFYSAANGPNLTGFDVEASDGHVGTVDEATYEPDINCLIVHTGGFLSILGKRHLVPPEAIRYIDPYGHLIILSKTKKQIGEAPTYTELERRRADAGREPIRGT
jgi:hypothetical protein